MNKKRNYTFLKVLGTWSDLLVQMLRQWRIFAVYALVITLISAVFGRWSYSCQYTDFSSWCVMPPQNSYVLIAYLIIFYGLLIFILGAFIVDVYDGMFKNSVFKPRNVVSFGRAKIKIASTLLKILLSLFISVFVALSIVEKPANPDFGIEFCYFLIAFAFVMVPLLMVRCSACFAYYINTGRFAVRKVYDNTSGRSYISVMLLLLLVLLCLIINIRLIGYFSRLTQTYNHLSVALSVEFIDSLLKLGYFAAILMLFQAQYIQMEKDEQQKAEELAASNEDAEYEEASKNENSPKKTAKAASKKKNKRKTQAKRKTSKKGKTSE